MKKLISMILVLLIFLTVSVALAEDTGIQIIGGPETEAAVVSLDDFKVGDTVKIEGYGEVTLTASSWANRIEKYDEDNWVTTYKGWNWGGVQYYDAGTEAIYLRLQLDILNTQKEPFNYYDGFADIICTYDNEYQFGGG